MKLYQNPYLYLIILLFLLNIISMLVVRKDKKLAKNGAVGEDRIPEAVLFSFAIYFGSIGVWLGMYIFRHKTRKWYFKIGIPFLLLQNIVFIYFIYEKSNMLIAKFFVS